MCPTCQKIWSLFLNSATKIVFFPSHFVIKDLNTVGELLQGLNKHNVNEWPNHRDTIVQPPLALVGIKASPIDWHNHLGIPPIKLFITILTQIFLKCLQNFWIIHVTVIKVIIFLFKFPLFKVIARPTNFVLMYGVLHPSIPWIDSLLYDFFFNHYTMYILI